MEVINSYQVLTSSPDRDCIETLDLTAVSFIDYIGECDTERAVYSGNRLTNVRLTDPV